MQVLTDILYNRKNIHKIFESGKVSFFRVLWLYKDLYTRESVYHLLRWFHIHEAVNITFSSCHWTPGHF